MKRDYTIENLDQRPPADICIGEIFFNKDDGKLYTWLETWDEFGVNPAGGTYNAVSRRLHAHNMKCIRTCEALQFLGEANSNDRLSMTWSVERFTEIKCFLRHMINEFNRRQNCGIELNDIRWNDNTSTIKIGSVNIEMAVTFMDNNNESHYSTLNFELLISGYMQIECVENDVLLFRIAADPMCRIFDIKDNRIDTVYETNNVESGFSGHKFYNMLYDKIQDWFE